MEATPAAMTQRRPFGVPRVARGVIRRERLLRRLGDGAPLVVVRGAVSSGKTTLVAQWLGEAPPDGVVVWVSRDLGINQRSAFWAQVLESLERTGLLAASRRRAAVAELEEAAPRRTAMRRAFEHVPHPLTLVLDNFGPPGRDWDRVADDLLHLLRRVRGLRVVAIGRSATRLDSVEAGLDVDRVVLDAADLRVTPEELQAIAAALDIGPLDEAAVTELGDAADWLIYPARYAMETAARTGAAVDPELIRGLDRELSDHLADVGLLDFAAACALVPAITVEAAAALTGASDAAARFEQLEQRSLGALVATEHGEEMFRFTGRARSALIHHLERADPARARAARRELVRWLRDRGEDAIAAELAVRAEDFDALERILMAAWGTVSREHGGLLLQLLQTVDPARILQHPILALYVGLSLNASPRHQAAAVPFLRSAIDGARRRARAAGPRERFVFAVGESIAARLTGDPRAAYVAAKRAASLDEILSHEDRSSFGDVLPIMLSQVGQGAVYGGDFAFARRAFLRAVDLGSRPPHSTTTNGWFGWLALLDVLEGRMRDAREHLGRIDDELWSTAMAQGYSGAGRLIATAYLDIDAGRFPEALERLDRLAPHFATIEHWAIIATARALATALGGAPAEAAAALRRLFEERDDRVGSAGLAAREVAGTDGVLELLELLDGDVVIDQDAAVRQLGRSAPTRLAVRAVRAALAGRGEAAARLLGRAEAARSAPLQDLLVAIAAVVVARAAEGAATGLRPLAIRIATVVEQEALHWPLALLADGDRIALIDSLGDSPLTPRLTAAFAAVAPVRRAETQAVVLTDRERDTLLALVSTATRAEIAAQQFVSVNTVRTHMKSLYRKLGVGDREAAIRRGVELGLLDPPTAARPAQ